MSGDPWAAAHAAIDEQSARREMGEAAFTKLLRDYRETFSSPAGERVMADLERLFGGATYVVGDPTESHARSAQRGVLLRVKQMVAWARSS